MMSGSGRPTRAALVTNPFTIETSATTSSSHPMSGPWCSPPTTAPVRVRDLCDRVRRCAAPRASGHRVHRRLQPRWAAARDGLPRSDRPGPGTAYRRLVCPPFEHGKEALAAIFTPDGRWVLSASVDGTARAWDWRTGKPVTPPLRDRRRAFEHRRDPDGKHAVVGGGQATLAVLDLGGLATSDTDPDTLCLRPSSPPASGSTRGCVRSTCRPSSGLTAGRAFRRQSPASPSPSLRSFSAPLRATRREVPYTNFPADPVRALNPPVVNDWAREKIVGRATTCRALTIFSTGRRPQMAH